jgi:hypothetical protein
MTRAGHVHLGKLRIRMSGPAGAYGRRIAERAIEQLSAELPAGLTGEIGRLELKVHVRAGASEAEVEQAIAGAMKNSLQNVRTCGSAEPPRQPTPQAAHQCQNDGPAGDRKLFHKHSSMSTTTAFEKS